jgi:hypothetical protein
MITYATNKFGVKTLKHFDTLRKNSSICISTILLNQHHEECVFILLPDFEQQLLRAGGMEQTSFFCKSSDLLLNVEAISRAK